MPYVMAIARIPPAMKASSACSFSSSDRCESRWLETETYLPTAIDRAPAASAATPAANKAWLLTAAPATPTTVVSEPQANQQ